MVQEIFVEDVSHLAEGRDKCGVRSVLCKLCNLCAGLFGKGNVTSCYKLASVLLGTHMSVLNVVSSNSDGESIVF